MHRLAHLKVQQPSAEHSLTSPSCALDILRPQSFRSCVQPGAVLCGGGLLTITVLRTEISMSLPCCSLTLGMAQCCRQQSVALLCYTRPLSPQRWAAAPQMSTPLPCCSLYLEVEARQRKCASPMEACAAISMPDITFSFFRQKYGILKDEYVGSLVHTLSKHAEVSWRLAVHQALTLTWNDFMQCLGLAAWCSGLMAA